MRFLYFIFTLYSLNAFCQDKSLDSVFVKVDSLYREDQFYFGLTYNLLQQNPVNFFQNGLSTGIHLGFLRDLPVNKSRTIAIAIGVGLSYNKYHQNIKVSESSGSYSYEIVADGSFTRNKLEQVFVDFPIEFRWRNSTPESHKFWRVYSGFKLRYLVFDKTKYVGTTDSVVLNNNNFNSIQYGPYVAFGFNTWNFHVYYGLNSIFKDAYITTEKIESKTLNLGLMFYIL